MEKFLEIIYNYEIDIYNEIKSKTIYKPKSNKELKESVKFWKYDRTKTIEEYGHIGSWDVSDITNMSYLFNDYDFNDDISLWDTSKVTNM